MPRFNIKGVSKVLAINLGVISLSSLIGISLNRSFVSGPREFTYEYSNSNSSLRQIPNPHVSKYPAFETIAIEDVRKASKTKDTIVLDGRTRQDYQNGHLPGAYHFAISDFEGGYPLFSRRFSKATRIIIYCRGGDCNLSRRLAELFYDKGYSRLQVYSAGYNEWFMNGNPVEKGKGSDFLPGN